MLTVSVHGPAGVLDLVVPRGAQVIDVAREYAEQAGLGALPLVHDRLGRPLSPAATLEQAGISAGQLLVAATGLRRPAADGPDGDPGANSDGPAEGPAVGAACWLGVAVVAALLAGVLAAIAGGPAGSLAPPVLAVAALTGMLPVGGRARARVLAAPAFGAAAVLAWAYRPDLEVLPGVVGLAALGAAVVAGAGRALQETGEEGLRVWVVAGVGVFAVTTLTALTGQPAAVAWSLLLAGAMLAARLVPDLVVHVPDHYLLDLDRLAVTAWSARTRPTGRRGRVVVPEALVGEVARRGSRLVGAAAVAVAAVAVPAAFLLLHAADRPVDRVGARVLVLAAGAALLLAARNHRHALARTALRVAGLGSLVAGVLALGGDVPLGWRPVVLGATVALAAVLVAVAVATGRGWRSAWWARRAEVAEALAGAVALASVLVAAGWFRMLWEAVSARS